MNQYFFRIVISALLARPRYVLPTLKASLLLLTLLSSSLFLSSCNTMKGLGQDITSSASFVQRKMGGESEESYHSMPQSENPPQWPK